MKYDYDNLYGYGDDWNDSFEIPSAVKPMSNINMEDPYGYKLDCSDLHENVPDRKANFYDTLYKKYYKTKRNPTNDELLDFLYDRWGGLLVDNKKEKQMKPIYVIPNLYPQPAGSTLKQTLVNIDDEHEEQLSVYQRADRDLSSKKLISSFDSFCKDNKELALEELTNSLYLYLSKPKVLSSLKMLSKVLDLKNKIVWKIQSNILLIKEIFNDAHKDWL